jgi:valyl-tRNA synthetase
VARIKIFDANLISDFESTAEVISGIRTIRKDKNIPLKDAIELKSTTIRLLLILIRL